MNRVDILTNLVEVFKYCFSREHFANWHGRSSRSEYLWFQVILFFVFRIFDDIIILLLFSGKESYSNQKYSFYGVAIIFIAITMAFVIASITALGRRLHDINLSAWVIVPFIATPISVGFLISPFWAELTTLALFFGLGMIRGTSGSNRFGDEF